MSSVEAEATSALSAAATASESSGYLAEAAKKGGISKHALIGIIVALVVLGVGLAVGICICQKRKKNKPQASRSSDEPVDPSDVSRRIEMREKEAEEKGDV